MQTRLAPLLGRPYREGITDCYGLVRSYYNLEYGIILRNYARPLGFDHDGLNLLEDNFHREGFRVISVPMTQLEPGDGLLFSILSDKPNHCGVITYGKMFLHHLYGKESSHDLLDPRWQRRLVAVLRHPDVTAANQRMRGQPISLDDLIPPHLRQRYQPS